MNIQLKCFADLAKQHTCDYMAATPVSLPDGATVATVIDNAAIPESSIKLVFVNGIIAGADKPLKDGDRVTLVPPTGGM